MTKMLSREQILCAELSPGFARLRRVSIRLTEGRALDVADTEFLADAFEKIIAGAHADTALEAVRKRGRTAMSGAQSDVWLGHVVAVERFRRASQGSTLSDALEHVAKTRHVAATTLEDCHKRYRKMALSVLRYEAAATTLEDGHKRYMKTALSLLRHETAAGYVMLDPTKGGDK